MAKKGNLIVGLDVGTTKVCVVVGEITDDGVDIIGIGQHPSKGLRKGVIVNIDATIEAIRRAVEEAELMAGCDILSVYASVSGSHVKGINSNGIVSVKSKTITEKDMERVIDGASAVVLPMDREVIHVIPQEYVVDNQHGISEPLGMAGMKFEANVHIVTASRACIDNIVKCAQRCGLNVNEVVLSTLASAEATLTSDEKEMGTVLVDIGGGTTDVVVYVGGSVVHTSVIPLGGNHVTQDITVGLRTPMLEAEKIKHKYGCALSGMVAKDETIDVPSVGGRRSRVLSRQILAEIIEPRMEEIFDLVKKEIAKIGCEDKISSGVVLTGGACALPGSLELAEQVFDYPVTRASPRGVGGLVDVVKSPMYATATGLVLYGNQKHQEVKARLHEEGVYVRVKEKIRGIFQDIF